jgi:hypothetical protein
MIFDTSQEGLLTLFKPYQAALMEYIWEMNERERTGFTSGRLYNWLQDHLESKSRASVIFFANDMVDKGFLSYGEKTGKGGYKGIWRPHPNALD